MLDDAAGRVRDAPLEPTRDHIRHVGAALAEVFEIRRAIYQLEPSLMPPEATEPASRKSENLAFARTMEQACRCESEGNLPESVRLFELFSKVTSSSRLREVSNAEIVRINEHIDRVRKFLGA